MIVNQAKVNCYQKKNKAARIILSEKGLGKNQGN